MNNPESWADLPLADWKETYATIHRWTQVLGKIRTRLSPPENHWWHSALQVSARGLSTGKVPYGNRAFDLELDFVDHVMRLRSSDGVERLLQLEDGLSCGDFYSKTLALLGELGLSVEIDPRPQEIVPPEAAIRLDLDHEHRSYDPDAARRHFELLLKADRLMRIFRSGFVGKCSPVHFFWGSFDLTCTRFSGRIAPARPGTDAVTREAYSHEVISCGFWPGSGNVKGPTFYAYAAPEPAGFAESPQVARPAFYNVPTHGYVLMLDDVRAASDPDRMVLDFFRQTYELGADLGGWDRAALERRPPFSTSRSGKKAA